MSKKTILIADDDVLLLKAMKVRLESAGFKVVATQDSYQAVDQARKLKPDLLVLDINMPAGSGFSIQQRVENLPELSCTPVVYITGEDPDQVDGIAHKMGAFCILHKPFGAAELIDTALRAVGSPAA